MACHFTASPFADTSPLAATRSRSGITTLMIGTRETRSSQLPWSLSVANSTPRVREALVSNRHELPIVAAGVQVQLQDAEGVVVGGFDSGWRGAQRGVIGPARAHDKGADSLRIVPDAIGILRDVALVVVIMAGAVKRRADCRHFVKSTRPGRAWTRCAAATGLVSRRCFGESHGRRLGRKRRQT